MRFFGEMLVLFSIQYIGHGEREDGTPYVDVGIPELKLKVRLDMVEGSDVGTIRVPLAYGSDDGIKELFAEDIRARFQVPQEDDKRIITPDFKGTKQ